MGTRMSGGKGHDDSTQTAAANLLHAFTVKGGSIEVVAGADTGASIALATGGIVVGSGASCDLRLSDRRVSREHLRLVPTSEGIHLVDLQSRNGTFVSGLLVRDALIVSSTVVSRGDSSLGIKVERDPVAIELSPHPRFGEARAHSTSMRHVFALLERAAKSDVTVLFEGDSGVGKDVLARSLHAESARREGPFVVVDCGAIPANLVESELFGHEKGAFTGATATKAGAFEQADGGTLFLDELGELPLDAQPKLLRAIENRSFRRIGGQKTIEVDVRIIAATNRRLRAAVRKKEFREDLFYRLAVVHVIVPPLAERADDVLPLAELFLRRARRDDSATLPPELARLLADYRWPGNARELRNVIERFATFDSADPTILFGAASERRPGSTDPLVIDVTRFEELPYHEAKKGLVEAFHRAILPRAIARAGGSVPRAAEQLGLPKGSVYRMLKELDEDVPEAADDE
jgi:transcriptional regulator with PAS, ATPase and Fis domain